MIDLKLYKMILAQEAKVMYSLRLNEERVSIATFARRVGRSSEPVFSYLYG